jgi:hypothetical protein
VPTDSTVALSLPDPSELAVGRAQAFLAEVSLWARSAEDPDQVLEALRWTLAVERLLAPRRAEGPAQTAARLLEARIGDLDVPSVGGRGNRSSQGALSRSRRAEFRLMAANRAAWEPHLPLSRSRVLSLIRDLKAAPAVETLGDQLIDLRLGDFREVLADVPDHSVDLVLTDPPYVAEFLPLWSDLGAFAARVLKPSGMLVAMVGQMFMPEAIQRLGEHLTYRWTIAYVMPGPNSRAWARRVRCGWKPVLIYGDTPADGPLLHDVVSSEGGRDKRWHHWGQSESGFEALLRLGAKPGDVVCDPFLGGGTTAVVAARHGCHVIGAELDPVAYETTLLRVRPRAGKGLRAPRRGARQFDTGWGFDIMGTN